MLHSWGSTQSLVYNCWRFTLLWPYSGPVQMHFIFCCSSLPWLVLCHLGSLMLPPWWITGASADLSACWLMHLIRFSSVPVALQGGYKILSTWISAEVCVIRNNTTEMERARITSIKSRSSACKGESQTCFLFTFDFHFKFAEFCLCLRCSYIT